MSLLEEAINRAGFEITQVVSGRARGVDAMGELWAVKNKINLKTFPARWNTFGNAAGMIRNRHMADYADALIALMVEEGSRGTENMVQCMVNRRKPYYIKLCGSSIIAPPTPTRGVLRAISDRGPYQGELW